ncbi:MAG TPA: hypothetical protein PK595_00910 [Bacteroidota bacterium]|nr:hypothetical protein [Bacteroidota bacterium]
MKLAECCLDTPYGYSATEIPTTAEVSDSSYRSHYSIGIIQQNKN